MGSYATADSPAADFLPAPVGLVRSIAVSIPCAARVAAESLVTLANDRATPADSHKTAAISPTHSSTRSSVCRPTWECTRQAVSNRSFANTGSARGITNGDAAAAGERGASGHVYTGPNGTTIAHGSAGERGAVVGPNGAAAGERGVSGTVVKGPTAIRLPTLRLANAASPSGRTERSADRGPSAARPCVARMATWSARGSAVTRNWSSADMRVQGNYVRNNFNNYGAFNRNWYHHYPNAWGRGFLAGAWAGANWASVNGWFGSDWPPYDYSYGDDVTYANNNVYHNDQPIATAAEYYQSAANLAQTGEQANIPNQPPSANNQPNATNPQVAAAGRVQCAFAKARRPAHDVPTRREQSRHRPRQLLQHEATTTISKSTAPSTRKRNASPGSSRTRKTSSSTPGSTTSRKMKPLCSCTWAKIRPSNGCSCG